MYSNIILFVASSIVIYNNLDIKYFPEWMVFRGDQYDGDEDEDEDDDESADEDGAILTKLEAKLEGLLNAKFDDLERKMKVSSGVLSTPMSEDGSTRSAGVTGVTAAAGSPDDQEADDISKGGVMETFTGLEQSTCRSVEDDDAGGGPNNTSVASRSRVSSMSQPDLEAGVLSESTSTGKARLRQTQSLGRGLMSKRGGKKNSGRGKKQGRLAMMQSMRGNPSLHVMS